MKKVIAVVLCALVLIAALVVPVSAVTVNAPEKKIVDRISTGIKLNDVGITVPAAYVKSMENFFLSIEMTEEQGQQINGYLDKIQAVLERNEKRIIVRGELAISNLKRLSYPDKKEMLDNAQKACEQVGLIFTFDSTTENVVIKDKDGKVWFDDAPIIKKTDREESGHAMLYTGLILAAVAALGMGGYVVTRRAKSRASL